MNTRTKRNLALAAALLGLLLIAAKASQRAYAVHTCPDSRCVMEYDCQACEWGV